MEQVSSYTDASKVGNVTHTEYWNDGGTPVEIKVRKDSYLQQSFGVISRWTERNGYERVVTANPVDVHKADKSALRHIAADLLSEYEAMFATDGEAEAERIANEQFDGGEFSRGFTGKLGKPRKV